MAVLTTAYYAYPIDQVNSINGQGLVPYVEHLQRVLMIHGVVDVQFDPGDAFKVRPDSPVEKSIGLINRTAAAAADVIIAVLPRDTPSIGVPMEIDRAVNSGKVVAVITDAKSWMLNYGDNPWFRVFPLDYGNRDTTPVALAEWLASTLAKRAEVLAGEQETDPLHFKVLPGGRLPIRGHADDAGLDLYVSETTRIGPGQAVDVPCGVAVELPSWSWGMLTGRSSARRTHGILVHTGIIDAGYRGPLFALAENTTSVEVVVQEGMRIAQLIVMPNTTMDLTPVQVEVLNPSERGTNGFGSTGR